MLRRMLKRSVTAVVLYRSIMFMRQEMARLKEIRVEAGSWAPRIPGATPRPAPSPAIPSSGGRSPQPSRSGSPMPDAPEPATSPPALVGPAGWIILTDPLPASLCPASPLQTVLPIASHLRGATAGRPPEIVHTRDASAPHLAGRRLLVNSISPLLSERVRTAILTAVATGAVSFDDVFVHLHEEDHVLQRIRFGGEASALDLLSKVTIVPLTPEHKARYEQRFGWRCTGPVYRATVLQTRSGSPFPGSKQHVNFLTVAPLQAGKGIRRLVTVAREAERRGLGHVHFHWAGPYAKALSSQLPEDYPSNFTWWGRLSPSHLRHMIPAMDSLVLPSRTEMLPLSLWEAASSGKRSVLAAEVGTRAPGFTDVVVPVDFDADPGLVLDRLLEIAARAEVPLDLAEMSRLTQMLCPDSFYAAVAAAIAVTEQSRHDLREPA